MKQYILRLKTFWISRNHEDWEDNDYDSRFGRRRSNYLGAPENDTVTALQMQLAAMTNLLQTK